MADHSHWHQPKGKRREGRGREGRVGGKAWVRKGNRGA